MARSLPSIDRVRELLDYDPATGQFTWRARTNRRIKSGAQAGCLRERYIAIGIDGVVIDAQRLAWLVMTGAWPTGEVDHKNGDGFDNAWNNLRDVPRKTNLQNIRAAKSTSKLGVLGVRLKNGSFKARISVDRREILLGSFATAAEAHAAYVVAKRQLHEGCTL